MVPAEDLKGCSSQNSQLSIRTLVVPREKAQNPKKRRGCSCTKTLKSKKLEKELDDLYDSLEAFEEYLA